MPTFSRLATSVLLLALLLPVPAASAAEFNVTVADFFFAPDELFVNAGDTVNWTWDAVAPHNVTPVQEGAFTPSETMTEGTYAVTFETEGTVPYFCTIHSAPDGSEGMVGVVNVLAEGEPLPEPLPTPRPAPDPGALPSADDAVGTALAWSSLFDDGAATTVLLGRDDVFADSLASGMAQGFEDAPLLLTASEALDDRVAAELTRLGAQRVVVLGGTDAISAAVVTQLEAQGLTVERVAGPTRIETAIALAQLLRPDATSAFLVRADGTPDGDPTQAFADSLSVGGLAASTLDPVLLSQTDRLSDSTSAYLQGSSIDEVTVVGGTEALSEQVATDLEALGIAVTRVGGATRFDTSQELASAFLQGPPDVVLLVDGQAPDAWVSGFTAASAAESAFIALSNGPDIPTTTADLLLVQLPAPAGTPVLCGPLTDPVACERAGVMGQATSLPSPDVRFAQMQGSNEVPPAPDGPLGDFTLLPTPADDAVCYEMVTYQLGETATGAHIHAGGAGVAGDVVVALTSPGDLTTVRDCTFDVDPTLVTDIFANPADYYVNVHTAGSPGGAVRGQLFAPEVIGIVELQTSSEVPPSDAAGNGFGLFLADRDDDTRVCYFMGFFIDGEEAAAGHIHEGAPDANGPVVQELALPPGVPMTGGAAEGTLCVQVDPALQAALLTSPSDHYVNIHTEAHPDGAIRGQLFNPFAGPPPGAAAAFASAR